jgi:hypothetical protein
MLQTGREKVGIPQMRRANSGGADDSMVGRSLPFETHVRTSLKLRSAHGRRPVYISQIIILNAKMCIFSEHGSFLKASGAMYRDVPAKFDQVFSQIVQFVRQPGQNPKFQAIGGVEHEVFRLDIAMNDRTGAKTDGGSRARLARGREAMSIMTHVLGM